MISIVTANWHSTDFLRMLVDSVRKHTVGGYEIVAVDNSNDLPKIEGCRIVPGAYPPNHASGVDKGILEAVGPYVLVLDVDAHILDNDWDREILRLYDSGPDVKLIASKGGGTKPYRPCVMFFKKEDFVNCGYTFWQQDDHNAARAKFNNPPKKGIVYDVGVFFALKVIDDGYKVIPLECSSAYSLEPRWGSSYTIEGRNYFYHHVFGTRFHNKAKVSGHPVGRFLDSRKAIFEAYEERFGKIEV